MGNREQEWDKQKANEVYLTELFSKMVKWTHTWVPLTPLRKDVECTPELSLCGTGSYDINL